MEYMYSIFFKNAQTISTSIRNSKCKHFKSISKMRYVFFFFKSRRRRRTLSNYPFTVSSLGTSYRRFCNTAWCRSYNALQRIAYFLPKHALLMCKIGILTPRTSLGCLLLSNSFAVIETDYFKMKRISW